MAELRRLAKLGRIVRGVAAKRGFEMTAFGATPDLDDDEKPINRLHLVFRFDPESVPVVAEPVPDELSGILEATAEAERASREEAARQQATELERNLRDSKRGLFGE